MFNKMQVAASLKMHASYLYYHTPSIYLDSVNCAPLTI